MSRLPVTNSDFGDWGDILNDYLSVQHNGDGTHKAPFTLVSASTMDNASRPFTLTETITTGTTNPTADYYPVYVDGQITSTDDYHAVGFSPWMGIGSRMKPGFGGVAFKGTVHNFSAQMTVEGCGLSTNEYTPIFYQLWGNIGTGFTQTTGPAGRYWGADFKVAGPIGVQPDLLNGPEVLVNNFYNGSPTSGASAAMGITTKPGIGGSSTHNAATTYSMDRGLSITGMASSSAAGFVTALSLGGTDTPWGANSRFTNAVTIQDYDTYGIKITAKYTGSTPTAAIAVADGIGPVILGGTTTPFATGTLQVLHTAQIDPLVRFGSNAVSNAFSFTLGNSSGNVKMFADAGGIFMTGTAAGDTGIAPSSTKAFHIGPQAGGKIFTVTGGGAMGFFATSPITQYNTTGTSVGFTAGGGTTVTDASTFTGNTGSTAYRISDVVRALKLYGLLAA